MQVVLHLGEKPIKLNFRGFDDEVDIDRLTSIDYSNVYSETLTVSSLLNQIGLLKAEADKTHSLKKLHFDIFEAETRRNIRKKYSEDSQKLTEKQLEEEITLNKAWQTSKKSVIEAKKNLDFMDALYWSIQSKDKKLNNLIKPVTPEELYNEIVDCTINNIVVKKVESPLTSKR